jgi:hypothetical protein
MTQVIKHFPVILSFDVGVIHLSYCLLTKKEFIKPDGSSKIDWDIIDWNNIDLTNREEQKCHCGAKAKLSNTVNEETKYYCKTHGKKVEVHIQPFDECFKEVVKANDKKLCGHQINSKSETKLCGKTAGYYRIGTVDNEDIECYYCKTHATQIHTGETKGSQLKNFKIKSSTTLNFDDVKYGLMMELEKRANLLTADYVVIENQPSFKNPRMKSIASTIYDYYLIRGIIDNSITKSNISQVKFMSPSNKLKIADEGDTKQLIKAKNTDDTKAYKLTKSLGIKYCSDLTTHLPDWQKHFNSFKKKDDLADSFLQGAYFYTNTVDDGITKPVTTNTRQTKKNTKKTIDKKLESESSKISIESSIDLTKETVLVEVLTSVKNSIKKPAKKSTKSKQNEIEV